MISRRALAKAYVSLMDEYPVADLSAAMAGVLASNKVDIDLLAKDISAEILLKKSVLTGTLSVAHTPSEVQVSLIKEALVKSLKVNDIQLDIISDESLIGGFKAETPAGTVDSSVITMLDKLEVA
jgi:F0F1-type ATP synthase delta subunit